MSASIASRPFFRIAIGSFLLLWIFFTFALMGNRYKDTRWYHGSVESLRAWTANRTDDIGLTPANAGHDDEGPISYNLSIPPKVGCDALVTDLQHRLITAYSELFKGLRYVNIWGYLETENKGDAAIWAAQKMLLSTMGIQADQACRFLDQCDLEKFNGTLEAHKPHSGIIMAGGGNFNDKYWEDQPARIGMISAYRDFPIRAFPQSVHMTHENRINQTQEAFKQHPNLQLAARDQPSYDWLNANLGQEALGPGAQKIKSVLVPDIAFMWGARPDFRTETKKLYDLVILARDDAEISAGGGMSSIPFGTGKLDLGGNIGNISYWKFDWKFTHTVGIDQYMPQRIRDKLQAELPAVEDKVTPYTIHAKSSEEAGGDKAKAKAEGGGKQKRDFATMEETSEFVAQSEAGPDQRAWAKADQGFRELASGRFVITDRLHGHILSTLAGIPHVLMDSSLGKNVNFHDTWTKDCQCVRVAQDFDQSLDVARLYFESVDRDLERLA